MSDAKMRILVCGSRGLPTTPADIDDDLFEYYGSLELIITGDCPTGADQAALDWARDVGVDVSCHVAGWEKHGKAAGPIRNQAMIDMAPDLVLACWDGKSPGTLDTIRRACAAGIRVVIPARGRPQP